MKLSRREGFTRKALKGRKEQLSWVCRVRTRACCTKKVAFSAWASFLSFVGLLRHIRHVHPRPGVEPCDSRRPFLLLKWPWFLYYFSSSDSTSPSFSPPPRFLFFFKREKCQFELPAWQTPLRNWYGPDKVVFIYFFCYRASQVPLPAIPVPRPPPTQLSILPSADSVTRNVCSEMLAWWQTADKKM